MGSVTSINLAYNHATFGQAISKFSDGSNIGQDVARGIRMSGFLTKIDLRGNGLGAEAGTALGQAVAASCSLMSIDVSNNYLGVHGGTAVAAGIRVSRCLTQVLL